MNAERYILEAEQYGKTVGTNGTNWPAAFGHLSGSFRAALDAYTGANAVAGLGCRLAWRTLGNARVLIEYERFDSGDVAIIGVLLNSEWCDAEDVIPAHTLQDWRESLYEEAQEAA